MVAGQKRGGSGGLENVRDECEGGVKEEWMERRSGGGGCRKDVRQG